LTDILRWHPAVLSALMAIGVNQLSLGVASTETVFAASYSTVPDSGIIMIRDYGCRDWGPEPVHYLLDTKVFPPPRLVLRDANGHNVLYQILNQPDGTKLLCFVAAVPKGGTAVYTLQSADHEGIYDSAPALWHRPGSGGIDISNEHFGVRVPPMRKFSDPRGVPADKVPPPILAWRQNGFDWVGGSRLLTDRKVVAYESECVENGRVTVAYRSRYRFAPAGEYVWQIRVSERVPVALITEEYDFGRATEGRDLLMLGAGENWKPEQIGFLAGEGPETRNALEPLGLYLARKRNERLAPIQSVGAFVPPPPPMPGEGLLLLEKIVPGGPWSLKTGLELRGRWRGTARPRPARFPSVLFTWARGAGLTDGSPGTIRGAGPQTRQSGHDVAAQVPPAAPLGVALVPSLIEDHRIAEQAVVVLMRLQVLDPLVALRLGQ